MAVMITITMMVMVSIMMMRSLIVTTRWQDETTMGEDANMINLHV